MHEQQQPPEDHVEQLPPWEDQPWRWRPPGPYQRPYGGGGGGYRPRYNNYYGGYYSNYGGGKAHNGFNRGRGGYGRHSIRLVNY